MPISSRMGKQMLARSSNAILLYATGTLWPVSIDLDSLLAEAGELQTKEMPGLQSESKATHGAK